MGGINQYQTETDDPSMVGASFKSFYESYGQRIPYSPFQLLGNSTMVGLLSV